MPWCETCSRFYNPNSVAPDGTCVACGASIGEPPTAEQTRVPWHFWVLVLALIVYLGWRMIQIIGWLVS